jgi:uncharacterized protein YndB with AHSA1/START domain
VPYDFKLTTTIPASAQEIYDAWLDSLSHSEMTQAPARMSNKIGAEVSAWNGYITGRNIELVPSERIVQSWRTTQFSDQHEDSIVTVMLEEIDGGTLLTLMHANVPDEQTSYEQGGWHEYYFEPMKKYFSSSEQATIGANAKPTAAKTTRKRAAMSTKSKRRTPKAKATIRKKKSKRVLRTKTGSKHSKGAKRKSGRAR